MAEPSLHELERDVGAARARLARDLSTLRSPETFSDFTDSLKHQALEAKDGFVSNLLEDLKAKAAANPTAALAIGAGIAWRLIKRPPIATALIGAGLVSLLRTEAARPNGQTTADYISLARGRLREQASDLAGEVRERGGQLAGAAAEKASELAEAVSEKTAELTGAAAEHATELATSAREQMQDWKERAAATIQDAARDARAQTASIAQRASTGIDELRRSTAETAEAIGHRAMATDFHPFSRWPVDGEARNNFLVGAATAAVIAALGIACQKRMREHAGAD
jgi:polyhydroxyalkanoate synthesis regulator phasin